MVSDGDARSYFDEQAARYDGRHDEATADGYALRMRLRAVLETAGDGPGDALDAGMGPGRLCAELERRGWTTSGLDASREMVETARTRLPGASSRLLQGEIESMPFSDGEFDLVTATGVLEYSDVSRALAELARVLRQDGRAVVSYPNPQALYAHWKTRVWYPGVRGGKRLLGRPNPRLPRGAPALRPREFEQELRRAGLVPVGRRATSYLPALTPLELVLPGMVTAVGRRLETRGGGSSARLFATQIVYEARRPSGSDS